MTKAGKEELSGGQSRGIGGPVEWAMADTFSAKLANIVLPEAGGKQVRLGSLWETGPAALVFLRHYG